ncbi:MAG: hypothetical protein OXC62_00705 [Aestuariivita sp.]|nr:hypothetical protein [Aestuariivita sp.]
MPETSFDQNGFSGGNFEITGLNAGASIDEVAYEGSFFGSEADSIAGTFTGVDDASDNPDMTIAGFFGTRKNE